MKYIDLHVHSLFSDGTCTPEELVDKASAQGLVAFALTDHDTVGGVERALEAAKDKHLQVIPGVELSCEYQHSLCQNVLKFGLQSTADWSCAVIFIKAFIGNKINHIVCYAKFHIHLVFHSFCKLL